MRPVSNKDNTAMEYMGRKFIPTSPEGAHNTTLNILPFDVTFLVLCRACGVTREAHRNALGVGTHGNGELAKIEQRLRCSSCGTKDAKLMYGYFAAPAASW
ncbi:hypothetical protein STOPSMEL_52 [Sinorhizobium phage StopSmel]|nr:hypothetical protein STOPSMEL_52 [Sinorhizobium phage StopSmel]